MSCSSWKDAYMNVCSATKGKGTRSEGKGKRKEKAYRMVLVFLSLNMLYDVQNLFNKWRRITEDPKSVDT
jgi:hypothetical protein